MAIVTETKVYRICSDEPGSEDYEALIVDAMTAATKARKDKLDADEPQDIIVVHKETVYNKKLQYAYCFLVTEAR